MAPPSEDIGIGKNRFGQAVFRLIQCSSRNDTIITQSFFDASSYNRMHAIRVNRTNQVRFFFVSKLTPNSDAY
jgi:hypothetical protein